MKRRDFLKLGMLGTTGALLGWEGVAGAAAEGIGAFHLSRHPYTAPWAGRDSRSPS